MAQAQGNGNMGIKIFILFVCSPSYIGVYWVPIPGLHKFIRQFLPADSLA